MILASLMLWVLSITKPQLGMFVYLLWVTAFALMLLASSLFFTFTSLIAVSSLNFLIYHRQVHLYRQSYPGLVAYAHLSYLHRLWQNTHPI